MHFRLEAWEVTLERTEPSLKHFKWGSWVPLFFHRFFFSPRSNGMWTNNYFRWNICQTKNQLIIVHLIQLKITLPARKKNPPRRGIEPRSPAWQAGILTTILPRTGGKESELYNHGLQTRHRSASSTRQESRRRTNAPRLRMAVEWSELIIYCGIAIAVRLQLQFVLLYCDSSKWVSLRG